MSRVLFDFGDTIHVCVSMSLYWQRHSSPTVFVVRLYWNAIVFAAANQHTHRRQRNTMSVWFHSFVWNLCNTNAHMQALTHAGTGISQSHRQNSYAHRCGQITIHTNERVKHNKTPHNVCMRACHNWRRNIHSSHSRIYRRSPSFFFFSFFNFYVTSYCDR